MGYYEQTSPLISPHGFFQRKVDFFQVFLRKGLAFNETIINQWFFAKQNKKIIIKKVESGDEEI